MVAYYDERPIRVRLGVDVDDDDDDGGTDVLETMISLSDEEFNMFHNIDRTIYRLLVIDLWRDPVEALQFVALWLWLERVGFKHVVKKILSLPYTVVNELADEAFVCLNIIHNDQASTSCLSSDVTSMQNLIHDDLCLQFFARHRLIAMRGLAKIVNEVCMRVLRDIMQAAMERNATRSLANHAQIKQQQVQQPTVQPGLDQGVGYGPVRVGLPWSQISDVVPPDDRTIFVTFSKGYPVHEWEVREFFTRFYGNCIESLHMQEVMPTEQSLFARIVCRSTSAIEMILNGSDKAKFNINGKHVWARKFVPKYLHQLS
ncbi:putative RNA-directed DNA polymerase (Reverse transcriptase), Ribonuclease H [Hibiscus syriacus]|uniref:RNA-directed DNA polymerase (Reverse transcriptase), Ribonuclease H n=1 Tax=Hibiscus syriacus TaxID=106335 RepID=A0A6A2YG91_HIBSY|nr:uncharacterized protein LOC120166289 [Hibiscus syriacus]KAE8676049.1 putative RNA-directed DNA polymerase (Reverse transcriptase), Ribonuclease H [Hibiscus syriacus]